MDVTAKLAYLRQSPRKVRLVIDAIRGLGVAEAADRLRLLNLSASQPLQKLLHAAVADAEHNFKLHKDRLYVKAVRADGGPTLKRWMARAYGRAGAIRKRSSHITLVLAEKEPAQSKTAAKKSVAATPQPTK